MRQGCQCAPTGADEEQRVNVPRGHFRGRDLDGRRGRRHGGGARVRASGNAVVYATTFLDNANVFLTFCLKIRALLQRKRKFWGVEFRDSKAKRQPIQRRERRRLSNARVLSAQINFVFLCSSSNTNNASLKSIVIQIILTRSLSLYYCVYLSLASLSRDDGDHRSLSTI